MSNDCYPLAQLVYLAGTLAWLLVVGGCGTTRLTQTDRSASEELLLSHAIDQSVGQLDLQVLAGQRVHLDTDNLGEINFRGYLTGAVRQHLLASGARLVREREQAEIVVEARAGAVSTAQHETLVGIPQTTVPAFFFGTPATLPEIAIIKKTIHIGVAKVGVFAYRVDTGGGVWQSGLRENQSASESRWYLGVGPYQTGDVTLNGGLPKKPRIEHQDRLRSPLEMEAWLGPPPPLRQEPQVTTPNDLPEPIELGPAEEWGPAEELPPLDPSWQWISPVVVSPSDIR